MERLTKQDKHGWYVDDQSVAYDGHRYGEVIDRLASYEDTGLAPEEVERVLDAYGRGMTLRTENGERLQAIKDIQINRLRKIVQAEKNGRLVMLPCSLNNPVYVIAKCEDVYICRERDTGASICPFEYDCQFDCCEEEQEKIFETAITGFVKDEERDDALHLFLGDMKFDFTEEDIGKTVFLTREDAEAALAERR